MCFDGFQNADTAARIDELMDGLKKHHESLNTDLMPNRIRDMQQEADHYKRELAKKQNHE